MIAILQMSGAIGAFCGSMTVGTFSRLLSRDCGDFNNSPMWIPSLIDTVLVLGPLAVYNSADTGGNTQIFLSAYCLTLAVIWLLTMLLDVDKSHFGIKFAVPVLAGTIMAVYWWYKGEDLTIPNIYFDWFSAICMILLGVLISVSLSDLGFELTRFVLDSLSRSSNTHYVYLIVRGLIAGISIVAVAYALFHLPNVWYLLAGTVFVLLSIFNQKNHHTSSIVSAAIVLVGIVEITECPLPFVLVMATLYNNFSLNIYESTLSQPLLPEIALLNDDVDEHIQSKIFLNVCLLVNVMYAIIAPLGSVISQPFYISALATAIWILVAPPIISQFFPDRTF